MDFNSDKENYNKYGKYRTYEQNKVLEESINRTFLLVIKGEITDPINIFNMFKAFDFDMSPLGKLFAYNFITGVPADFRTTPKQVKQICYYDKIFRALERETCTLVPPTWE